MLFRSGPDPTSPLAAWEFISKNHSLTWDLVTLCPPWVFGPVISEVNSPAELGSSMRTFSELLLFRTQSPEALVDMQVGWVDVRDVALAHARALEVPEAGGQRFILCSSMHTWQEWCMCAIDITLHCANYCPAFSRRGELLEYSRLRSTEGNSWCREGFQTQVRSRFDESTFHFRNTLPRHTDNYRGFYQGLQGAWMVNECTIHPIG